MGFFSTARRAGAEAYGAKRAEQYGRRAKAWAALGFLLAAALVVGCVLAVQGALGG